MAKQGYLIGEGVRLKLRQVFDRVDGMPVPSNIYRVPTDLSAHDIVPPVSIRMATYTGAWSIGGSKEVRFLQNTATTAMATNLFFAMPDRGDVKCAVSRDGTAWYVIAAEHVVADVVVNASLGTAGLQFTRSQVQVLSTATASIVTIGTTSCATTTT